MVKQTRYLSLNLKKHLRRNIDLREVDADLESSEFAKAVVETFDEIMQARNYNYIKLGVIQKLIAQG